MVQHLKYNESEYDPTDYHDAIVGLLHKASNELTRDEQSLSILDIGSGHGTLMKRLKRDGFENTYGIDCDEMCVQMSSRYGICHHADIETLCKSKEIKLFDDIDVAILAHVLEHLQDPRETLDWLRKIAKFIIIVVPNPSRIKVLFKHNLLSRNYSNRGHYYSWDRSHFENFLITHCNLMIMEWVVDRVHFIPFRRMRDIYRRLGLLDRIERLVLPRVFPYFSNSLIVLCKEDTAES